MVDGLANSVLETDVVPSPAPVGSSENFAGNAFTTKKQVLEVEGSRDYDWAADRRWTIINTNNTHYASGEHTGYGIHLKGGAIPLLAKEGSWVAQRAKFASKPLWVVKDNETEKGTERMWPAGKYVPQSRGEVNDSIGKWVEGKASVEKEDILLFLTVGESKRRASGLHIQTGFTCRPDTYPPPRGLPCVRLASLVFGISADVQLRMPVENLKVSFRPQNFFTFNPSMDVPEAKDAKSVLVSNGENCSGCR